MRKLGPVASANAKLKAAGREERVYRTKGYYYVTGGVTNRWSCTGIYGIGTGADPSHLWAAVKRHFKHNNPEIELGE